MSLFGMNKGELAVRLGFAPSGLSRRLNGDTSWTLPELRLAAELLDTSIGYLLGETDDDSRPLRRPERRETPAASAVEASRDRVAANAVHSVPPEGFEPPTFGTGNQRSIP